MFSSVVDQCLSLAFASASRKMGFAANANMSMARVSQGQTPLAAYPRLAAVLARAESDGVFRRNQALGRFY